MILYVYVLLYIILWNILPQIGNKDTGQKFLKAFCRLFKYRNDIGLFPFLRKFTMI